LNIFIADIAQNLTNFSREAKLGHEQFCVVGIATTSNSDDRGSVLSISDKGIYLI